MSVVTVYIGLAMLIGAGLAVQLSMISAMSLLRGSFEATWLSLLATVGGFTFLVTVRALQRAPATLPAPFDGAILYLLVAVAAAAGLAVVIRGVPSYFAVTGLFAIPLLVGAGVVGSRLGIGLYLSSVVAGQLVSSVVLDHVGAFGIPVRRVDLARVGGVALLVLGVALVRGVKT